MHYDELGLIVSDTSGPPSCFGDSCAETGRVVHLGCLLGLQDGPAERLLHFVTSGGYVRHPSPTLPYDWRETDFSSDQALPLYLAFRSTGMTAQAEQMKDRFKKSGWNTGNGDPIAPFLWAALLNSKMLMSFFCIVAAVFFCVPFRWSDSKKRFESTKDATGDYLNYFHASVYAYPWARWVRGKTILAKITAYYSNESNAQELLRLYAEAIKAVKNG